MAESEFYKIIRKTGRKPVQCKCALCKTQCERAPCIGTPSDIEKIIDAGYKKEIFHTDWGAGIVMRSTNTVVEMFQAEMTKTGCVFFKNGLCELHDKGLKPTEGRLSHHSHKIDNFNGKKSIGWHVARTWLDPDNADTIKRIEEKLKNTDT